MADIIDISGVKFGKLTALEPLGKVGGVLAWYCVCDCGMYCFITGTRLRRLERTSCRLYGCKRAKNAEVIGLDETKFITKTRSKPKSRHYGKIKPRKETDIRFNARRHIKEMRKRYIDKLKVGDIIRFNPGFAGGYRLGTILKIYAESFWIKTDAGERRLEKRLVVHHIETNEVEYVAQSV